MSKQHVSRLGPSERRGVCHMRDSTVGGSSGAAPGAVGLGKAPLGPGAAASPPTSIIQQLYKALSPTQVPAACPHCSAGPFLRCLASTDAKACLHGHYKGRVGSFSYTPNDLRVDSAFKNMRLDLSWCMRYSDS